MAYTCLRTEIDPAGFAVLTLNRPDKLNALSILLRQELALAVSELEADPAVCVLVLTGAGRAFSVGLDVHEWATSGEVAAGAYTHDAVAALARFSGPVIGAINGLAVTGGLEIAVACDVLIASDAARFADTHVKAGLLPGWGGSVRLARLVGLGRAKELALTGRFLDAPEALAWGMVNRVVAPDALLPEAMQMARQMLAGHPATLVAYKRLLDECACVAVGEALALERKASLANNNGVSAEEIQARIAPA